MDDTQNDKQRLINAGQSALQRGSFDEALQCFKAVCDHSPDDLQAGVGLGLTVALSGETQQGIDMLSALLEKFPSLPVVPEALGTVHADAGSFPEAEIWFRKALRIGGFYNSAACNLGMALNELGRFDEAAAMFRRCLRQNADDVSARYHLGLCQLLSGDFIPGWEGFALRNRVAGRPEPEVRSDIQRWTGQPLAGKSIILLAEQGLGDTIQFSRYATLIADRGATVYLQCADALADILATVSGVSNVFGPGEALPKIDFQVSLLDLPRLFESSVTTIPFSEAYISVPKSISDGVTVPLRDSAGHRRVGLVWSGNPDNKTDYKRSIPLAELSPILNCPDITFYSLQIGPAQQQLENIPADIRPVNLCPEPLPLGDVAALICSLDLLISVDTSLAHLAGALGRPVYTLISYVPDWRWLTGRHDTDWYHSMRLFRQETIGDWSGPVNGIRSMLTDGC